MLGTKLSLTSYGTVAVNHILRVLIVYFIQIIVIVARFQILKKSLNIAHNLVTLSKILFGRNSFIYLSQNFRINLL